MGALEIVKFLHVLSAVLIGFYLFVPIILMRLSKQSIASSEGSVRTLALLNRIGQYVLIVAFLTGGYMVSKFDLSVIWMILSVVLILVMFGLSGVMSKPLKRLVEAYGRGEAAEDELRKTVRLSAINAAAFLLILIIMNFPTI